ncbi:DUF4352 domain-containing protein [Micromonosporaceae bacterium Da 78-11]
MTNLPQRHVAPSIVKGQSPARTSRVASTWIAGGVLALVALGSAGCGSSDSDDKATPPLTTASAPAAGGATQSAAEGTFAFTVTGSKCGVKTVGPADLAQTSTGQFCLVDVSIKNVGKEATLLDGSAQKAIDAQGKEYPVADLATVYLNDKSPGLLEAIKPGAEVKGVLPFQVPASTKLAAVVLHGAKSTPGVRVALS